MINSSKRQRLSEYSIFLVMIAMFVVCSILSPYSSNPATSSTSCVSWPSACSRLRRNDPHHQRLHRPVGGPVLALSGVLAVSTYKSTQSIFVAFWCRAGGHSPATSSTPF
jgi:inositol transport system permease protein